MQTTRQANLVNAFLADLLSARTWAGALHLLIAFPLGLAYFLFVVIGSAVGLASSVMLLGLFLLAFVVGGVWVFTALERELARLLLGVEIPRQAHEASGTPVKRLRAYLSDASFWKGLAYLLAKLPWGAFCFALTVAAIALSLALLSGPLTYDHLPLTLGWWRVRSPLAALSASLAGLGVLWLSSQIIRTLADLSGSFAAFMLSEGAEAGRPRREAEALARIANNVAYAGDLKETLDALARVVSDATGANACAVLLRDEATGGWRAGGEHGLPDGFLEAITACSRLGARLPSQEAVTRQAPVTVRAARRALASDPLFAPLHPYLENVPWDTLVSVPLTYRQRSLGSLAVYYAAGQEPHKADGPFLTAIADQAAVAVENARLIAQAQDRAALEERQKLARDLHDSVSQALFGIALGARTAKASLAGDAERAGKAIDYVLQLAEGGIAEMRALIFELRPESLAEEGLVAALAKHAAALQSRHGLKVLASLGNEPALKLEAKETLYRVAQEGMHNAVRHARASSVRLGLKILGDTLFLEVADDGIGFEPDGKAFARSGLRSARERLRQQGGDLVVESHPGGGTRLLATLPVGARGEATAYVPTP